MSDIFKVKVDNSFEFDISANDVSELDIIKSKTDQYHILKNNASYKAKVLETDFLKKSYSVKINNNIYDVKINNQLDALIASMGFSSGTNKQINKIKAPMPGLILDIMVIVGQEVSEDDPLLILEAMKMENVIVSQREGVIKTVAVTKGEAVDKSHLLIEFE